MKLLKELNKPKKYLTFTEKNISIKDMFHYGRDHLETAKYLFEEASILRFTDEAKNYSYVVSTLDSAGYLAALGIEQILKGCWLWEKKRILPTHKLSKIIKEISFLNEINFN